MFFKYYTEKNHQSQRFQDTTDRIQGFQYSIKKILNILQSEHPLLSSENLKKNIKYFIGIYTEIKIYGPRGSTDCLQQLSHA